MFWPAFLFWLIFAMASAFAASGPQASKASQAQVNAGTNDSNFLTPKTHANYSGTGGGGSITNAASSSITNSADWNFWNDAANYYAKSRFGQLLVTNDFGGLLMTVDRITPSTTLCSTWKFASIYRTYSGTTLTAYFPYWITNGISLTNGILASGSGDNATIIQGAPALNGPMITLGTKANPIAGICKWDHIRFEGLGTGSSSEGIVAAECAEPVFDTIEVTSFGKAQIRIANTNVNHWSQMFNCWIVNRDANSHGVLFSATPASYTEFLMNNNIFEANGGTSITVSNYFRNLNIVGGSWKDASASATACFFRSYAGEAFNITGVTLEGNAASNAVPIRFEARAAATNINSSITAVNLRQYTGGPTNMILVDTNVSGVNIIASNPNGTVFQNPSGGNSNNVIVTKDLISPLGPIATNESVLQIGITGTQVMPIMSRITPSKSTTYVIAPGDTAVVVQRGVWEENTSYAEATSLSNGLNSLTFSNLVGSLSAPPSPLPYLTNLAYPNLMYFAGAISGTWNMLTSLNYSNLVYNIGGIGLTAPLLKVVAFPSLIYEFSGFAPATVAMTNWSAPLLTHVGQSLGNVGTTPGITNLGDGFASLKYIGLNFNATAMANCTTIGFAALQTIGGSFQPTTFAAVTNLSFPALQFVGTTFAPATMAALGTINFPALTNINGAVTIATMAGLTNVSFAAMQSYGSTIDMTSSLGNLTTVTLGTSGVLRKISGATTLLTNQKLDQASVNAILALLVSLDGTGGTTLWGAGKTLNISGGTSAAPSGQGIVDKATLITRGATVTTN